MRVEWTKESGGRWKMEEVPGSEKFFPAQLVFLALGFLGPETQVIKGLNVKQDGRSNIQTPPKVNIVDIIPTLFLITLQKYSTNIDGVFAAGDCRRGQSLIVWGIKYVPHVMLHLNSTYNFHSEGRGAAAEVDEWLMGGSTRLPIAGGIKTRVSSFYSPPYTSEFINLCIALYSSA